MTPTQSHNPTLQSGHAFSQVPQAEINRSTFDRSSELHTAFEAGYLVPIWVDEALPGDTLNLSFSALLRLSPTALKLPIFSQVVCDIHVFGVPNRLLYDKWERLQGARIPNPSSSINFLTPTIAAGAGTHTVGSIYDYMGLPIWPGGAGYSHAAWWLRAYNQIYNQWYRDQNLIDSAPVNIGDGPDNAADYVLLRRAKRHDYFTAALPFPQKGNAVTIPLGTSAPVNLIPPSVNTNPMLVNLAGTAGGYTTVGSLQGTTIGPDNGLLTDTAPLALVIDPNGRLQADLSAATSATINALRLAFTTQQLLERDARGGTRYTEIIKSHFGVISPDARMQRPEYLGGVSFPIIAHPVSNTAGGATPQGAPTSFAVGTVSNDGRVLHSFTEHCTLIAIASVRSQQLYNQGMERMWSRSTRYDYYMPTFANLGEQAILAQEIFTAGTSNDSTAWGYQERWAEYRYKESRLTSLMRTNVPGTLSAFHLAPNFTALPPLAQDFIEENPPMSRILADPSQPAIIGDFYFHQQNVRPMPIYSVPGLRVL